jgi:hypothetical protein
MRMTIADAERTLSLLRRLGRREVLVMIPCARESDAQQTEKEWRRLGWQVEVRSISTPKAWWLRVLSVPAENHCEAHIHERAAVTPREGTAHGH